MIPPAGTDVTTPPRAPAVTPRSTLVLGEGLSAWEGLNAAFASVIAYATGQVARAANDPAKAVHEYRKSIRRARALVRLVRPLLKARHYEHLDGELRQAVLETSFMRDAEVLGETTKILPQGGPLSEAIAALRHTLLAQQASVSAPGVVREVLARGAERVAILPMHLAKALPTKVAPSDLARALRDSYRKTRRCRRNALETRQDDDVHDWRKRAKELRYQLEMVEPGEDQPHERCLGEVAKGLGLVTDLMVLRAAVRAHAETLGPAHTDLLLQALDRLIPERFDAVATQAAPFFEPRARAFADAVLSPAPALETEPAPAPAAAAAWRPPGRSNRLGPAPRQLPAPAPHLLALVARRTPALPARGRPI